MPVTSPPPSSLAHYRAAGSISEIPATQVIPLGTWGHEYQTGIANLSKPTTIVQEGGRIGVTRDGEGVTVLRTAYDPSVGEVQVAVTYQDTGLKEGDEALAPVEAEVVGTAPAEAAQPGYVHPLDAERAKFNIGGGVAAEDYQSAAPIPAQPPSVNQSYGYDYQPQQYVPSSQPYYNPYQGAQQAPSQPTGTGSGPDPANPYGGGQSRGPDIASPGYAEGWL